MHCQNRIPYLLPHFQKIQVISLCLKPRFIPLKIILFLLGTHLMLKKSAALHSYKKVLLTNHY